MPLNVKVTGRDIEITDAMLAEVRRALRPVDRRMRRFPADLAQTDVLIERLEKLGAWQVRVTLGAGPPDHTFTSQEQAASLATALRLAADDIIDQVDRFREKVQRQTQTYDDVRARKEQEGTP